jgi:hypothetical protein
LGLCVGWGTPIKHGVPEIIATEAGAKGSYFGDSTLQRELPDIKHAFVKSIYCKMRTEITKCPIIYQSAPRFIENSLAHLKGKLCFTKPAPTNLVLKNQASDL